MLLIVCQFWSGGGRSRSVRCCLFTVSYRCVLLLVNMRLVVCLHLATYPPYLVRFFTPVLFAPFYAISVLLSMRRGCARPIRSRLSLEYHAYPAG